MARSDDLVAELKLAVEANGVLKREIRRLRVALRDAQRLIAESAPTDDLRLQVAQSGGMSVYGLNTRPTTLYKSQWERLLSAAPDITAFIAEHDAELLTKAQSRVRLPTPTPGRRTKHRSAKGDRRPT